MLRRNLRKGRIVKMNQSITDALIEQLDVKLKRLRRGEVERVPDLRAGQVDLIRGIYSDQFDVSSPLIDNDNYSITDPKYVLLLSRREEERQNA